MWSSSCQGDSISLGVLWVSWQRWQVATHISSKTFTSLLHVDKSLANFLQPMDHFGKALMVHGDPLCEFQRLVWVFEEPTQSVDCPREVRG